MYCCQLCGWTVLLVWTFHLASSCWNIMINTLVITSNACFCVFLLIMWVVLSWKAIWPHLPLHWFNCSICIDMRQFLYVFHILFNGLNWQVKQSRFGYNVWCICKNGNGILTCLMLIACIVDWKFIQAAGLIHIGLTDAFVSTLPYQFHFHVTQLESRMESHLTPAQFWDGYQHQAVKQAWWETFV